MAPSRECTATAITSSYLPNLLLMRPCTAVVALFSSLHTSTLRSWCTRIRPTVDTLYCSTYIKSVCAVHTCALVAAHSASSPVQTGAALALSSSSTDSSSTRQCNHTHTATAHMHTVHTHCSTRMKSVLRCRMEERFSGTVSFLPTTYSNITEILAPSHFRVVREPGRVRFDR